MKWMKCPQCAISACSTSRIIVGEGSPNSVALVVGGAPGAVEVVRKQPFVGSAGKICRAILLKGIETSVFSTYLIACRPPKDRAPLTEIAYCKPRLLELIDILNPALIILLGTTAKTVLTPSIVERGKFYLEGTRLAVWLYSPEHIQRQGGIALRESEPIVDIALSQYEYVNKEIHNLIIRL